jgi:hypothetical protein
MAKIKLVNGGEATVSDPSFDRFNKYLWYKCEHCQHIIRVVRDENGNRTVYMAAEVMGMSGIRVGGACNPCPVPALAQN